jgi:hypothetical protein
MPNRPLPSKIACTVCKTFMRRFDSDPRLQSFQSTTDTLGSSCDSSLSYMCC